MGTLTRIERPKVSWFIFDEYDNYIGVVKATTQLDAIQIAKALGMSGATRAERRDPPKNAS